MFETANRKVTAAAVRPKAGSPRTGRVRSGQRAVDQGARSDARSIGVSRSVARGSDCCGPQPHPRVTRAPYPLVDPGTMCRRGPQPDPLTTILRNQPGRSSLTPSALSRTCKEPGLATAAKCDACGAPLLGGKCTSPLVCRTQVDELLKSSDADGMTAAMLARPRSPESSHPPRVDASRRGSAFRIRSVLRWALQTVG